MSAVQDPTSVYGERRRRADELMTSHPYVAEPLRLYRALIDAQEEIFTRARADKPAADDLVPYVVRTALPRVMDAAMTAGTEMLREAVLLRFNDGDLDGIVADWLAGESESDTDVFLARAATTPVLEALPELARSLRAVEDDRRCPVCGGLPQLSLFTTTDDALVTGQRRLVCSRCAAEWPYARMVCASCRASGGAEQPILADEARLPHLRVDACDVCHSYLVTVDARREPSAVPLVDEIAALPLDLIAAERGYTKISRNVMGF